MTRYDNGPRCGDERHGTSPRCPRCGDSGDRLHVNKSAVRRRQRREARSRAFQDSARIDWLEVTACSIEGVQKRMSERDDETVRQAIDSLRGTR